MLAYKDITDELKESIAQDYNQGMLIDVLVSKYNNIHIDLIVQCLYEKTFIPKRFYVPRTRSHEWKQAVVDYYTTHSSFDTIRFFRTSDSILLRTLREFNVVKRSHAEELQLNKLTNYGSIENYNKIASSKCIETSLLRYGVTNFAKSPVFKERCTTTCMQRYGVENPMQAEISKEHMKRNNQRKYGVNWPCQLPKVRAAMSGYDSKPNLKFKELLVSNNIQHTRETTLDNFVYDFHILPNILVEINPSATHNVDWSAFGSQLLPHDYHQCKYETAVSNGYYCVMLWDWDSYSDFIDALLHTYVSEKPFYHISTDTVSIDPYISVSEFEHVLTLLPKDIYIEVQPDKIHDARYKAFQCVETIDNVVLTDTKDNSLVDAYTSKYVCKIIPPKKLILRR